MWTCTCASMRYIHAIDRRPLGWVDTLHARILKGPDKTTHLSTVITQSRRSRQQNRAGIRQAICPPSTVAFLVCPHRPFSRHYPLVQRFAGRRDLRVNGGAERKAATGDATRRTVRAGHRVRGVVGFEFVTKSCFGSRCTYLTGFVTPLM